MKHFNIRQIIDKYVSGVASPEEIAFLLRQFKRKDMEAELRSVIRQQLESDPEAAKAEGRDWDNALAHSYKEIKSRIDDESKKDKGLYILPRSRRIGLKIGVAAAVALLAVSSVFIFTNNKDNTGKAVQKEIAVQQNDIAPGGNNAVLTLANGSRVVLDSIQNGMVSIQGNTKILKLKNGLLAYDRSGSKNSKIFYNTISTPRGGQYQVVLSDGTKVWLNAASSIRFPNEFRGKTREVRITGEVYFEVAPHPQPLSPEGRGGAIPFIVKVNGMEIQVLGTHFNVMAYKDEPITKVTLLEGAIKVKEEDKEILLKPGEQAQVNRKGRIKKVEGVDLNGVVAWKNNQFWFDDDNIQTVMRELSRWYNMDVVIRGDIPQHFGGYISRDIYVSKVFEALQATSHLQYEVQDSTIIVSP